MRLALLIMLTAHPFVACGVTVQPLMPTPVVYAESGFDPLAHIPEHERWIPRRVFYATNRSRADDVQHIAYDNTPSREVTVGMALVGFGGPDMTWSTLGAASTTSNRKVDVDLSIAGVMEKGRFAPTDAPQTSAAPQRAGFMLETLSDVIDGSRDRDVLVYVHGAKVNFYNACVFAAQLDHFMGRDMTSIAFAWPTHQDILSYVTGDDVDRAYVAAESLASFLELLAEHTPAERIHVLSWSAGARVAMSAVASLVDRHPEIERAELRERLRLGTIYFAAGDVPTHEFLAHIDRIHALADQLIVTRTDDDSALAASESLLGGDTRIGREGARLTPAEQEHLRSLDRFEVIDVAIGAADRGFDIVGHRYWFDHPWASSDVILSVRTGLPPTERGLDRSDEPMLYTIPPDYPSRLHEMLSTSDLGGWRNDRRENPTSPAAR